MPNKKEKKKIVAIDLFCGAGGLTHGLTKEGITVVAGVDLDPACKFAYEENNNAKFIQKDIANVTGSELSALFPKDSIKVIVGCAPCQPFSSYSKGKIDETDKRWNLLSTFGNLCVEVKPDVISMENVPKLRLQQVFKDFVALLESNGYKTSYSVVYGPDYGLAQTRKRLLFFASKLGAIEITPTTHTEENYVVVKDVIFDLEKIGQGKKSESDDLHRAASLSDINKKRIKVSKPGGTWREWDRTLRAKCHKKKKGKSFPSVYGRMSWNEPSPTITTQFYGFGNGRFGHPNQNRAISIREGALLQSFPPTYKFYQNPNDISMRNLGMLIGNAVPVILGKVVGKTITSHYNSYAKTENRKPDENTL